MAPTLVLISLFALAFQSFVSADEPHARRRHHHNLAAKRAPLGGESTSDASSTHVLESRAPAPKLRFKYGTTKVRGVNLGGWLVLEPFITPTLFKNTGNEAIVDEYTFGQYQSTAVAQAALKQHWDTWITKADFVAIKAAGLNHVRLPIGYWAYDVSAGEPYNQGQDKYLQLAIQWAGEVGLKVWIDLHGAPGSQNGFDNSGQRMQAPTWHTKKSNIDRTSKIIKMLAAKYSGSQYPQVTAIAPLNEPAGFYSKDLLNAARQYWFDSYNNIRFPFTDKSKVGDLLEVIHDAFQPLTYWKNSFPNTKYAAVAVDTHHYEVFSDGEVARTYDQHIQSICKTGNSIKSFASGSGGLWTVTGEWSNAIYDCALWLNGRGVGARYDGTRPGSSKLGDCAAVTGDGSKWSASYKAFQKKFWMAQAQSYEKGQGWFYWTWKTESADEWSYSAGMKTGNEWIPKNVSILDSTSTKKICP